MSTLDSVDPLSVVEQPRYYTRIESHTSPESIVFVALLATLIGQFIARPTPKVEPIGRQVELTDAASTRVPVLGQLTDLPANHRLNLLLRHSSRSACTSLWMVPRLQLSSLAISRYVLPASNIVATVFRRSAMWIFSWSRLWFRFTAIALFLLVLDGLGNACPTPRPRPPNDFQPCG